MSGSIGVGIQIKEGIDGSVVCSIEGHLEASMVNAVNERLHDVLEGKCTNVIFDLKNLDYIASAGLRLFLYTAKKLKSRNGQLFLASVQRGVQRNVDVSGLGTLLPSYESTEAALAAFKKH